MCDPGRKKRKFQGNLAKFPGPRPLPILGNAPQLLFPPDEIFTWLENVNRKWGDVARFWVFGKPKVFVNSYDVAMQLLSRKTFLLKSEEFEPLKPVGGESLAGTSPDTHSVRRKQLGPGYGRQAVDQSLEVICRHARKLRDSLMVFAENGVVFDVMDHTCLHAYKIGLEIAVGHDAALDILEFECKDQIEAWHMLLYHLVNRSFKPWLKYDSVFKRTLAGKQVAECYEKINKFGEKVIFFRQQWWEYMKANRFNDDNGKIVEVKPECYLDLLLSLEDEEQLTKQQTLHDLNLFLVAGYDTTGTALAWILHLLSTHPDIQEKCVEELKEIFLEEPRPGSSTSSSQASSPPPSYDTFTTIFSLVFATSDLPLNASHLKRMKYIECCIKEALRLYPVLPWLLRRTDEDIELEDGRVIPAGVDVPINTYIIHRNPKDFNDPEEFLPERYLNTSGGEKGAPPPLSFGAGARMCPGIGFAMQELKVLLAHLLLEFKWESSEEGNKKCLFHGVLVPADGIHVKISKRDE